MSCKILTINPGSTSTKIALYDGSRELFSKSISHDAKELKNFRQTKDQGPYREKVIFDFIEENHIDLNDLSAVVGRGGGLISVEGGVYEINDLMLDHARREVNGVSHPASLGPVLAWEFAQKYNCRAFVVNPPDTDELQPVARMTGIRGVYRNVHLHALDLKEMCIQYSAQIGKRYEECNYIACHIGGGISVSAHRRGRMVDGNDIAGGEGPMAPTRCGSVPVKEIIDYCFSGVTKEEASLLCSKTGGFVSLLGTSDTEDVIRMAQAGEKIPYLALNTMIYQIAKEVGSMASVLHGDVDALLIGGDHNHPIIAEGVKKMCSYIAPVVIYYHEFEMSAMASGALRVIEGREKVKIYTGIPVWNKADFERSKKI